MCSRNGIPDFSGSIEGDLKWDDEMNCTEF